MKESSSPLAAGAARLLSRGRNVLLAAFALLATGSDAGAAPVFSAATSTNADSATHTVSHTVGGDNRLLTVCVALEDTSASVSNVVFNGTEALTKVTQVLPGAGKPRMELWRRIAPSATTANVVVTLSSSKKAVVGVMSFTGVDQATPISVSPSASGISAAPSVAVASEVGDLVADCMGTLTTAVVPTAGGGQTQRFTRQQGGTIRGIGSTEAGAAGNVTMSWTTTESKEWATIGYNINAVPCGNGAVDAGEQCDDGNLVGGDCCSATCQYESNGSSCGSGSDSECDNPDTCNGAGTCLPNNEPDTADCGDAGTECVVQDKCDGAGACEDNGFVAAETGCGSDLNTECDNPDTCDGSGTCQPNHESATADCGDAGTECTNQDKCDGAGACDDKGFVPAETSCGSGFDDVCDNPDTCDGAGTCDPNFEPATVDCGDAGTECVVQDKCDGAGACEDNGFVAAETGCGSDLDTECDNPDTCDGSGTCQPNHELATADCGDAGTECTNQDKCDGAGACDDKGFVPATTACGLGTDDECTNPDTCDGSGTCQPNNEADGLACGSDTDGECDNPDTCSAGACAPNHEADTVDCGDAGTECTNQDKCDGAGACSDNGFVAAATACGSGADGECDNPDTCDGSGACQSNFEADTVDCGDAGTECTNQDKCDGAGACSDNGFVAASTACGSGTDGECDNPDTCDGSGTCQSNFEADTVDCGDAGTECTNQDKCDGAGACADNGFVAAATSCGDGDDTECTDPDTCDGSGTCQPNDEADGLACGSGTDTECDNPDTCSAGSCESNYEPAATACGSGSDTACDDPDACDGSGSCEANTAADGTACNDGAFCNGADTCLAGACDTHIGDPCAGPDGDADCSEVCDEGADACSGLDPDGSACDDGDSCSTGETCEAGTCANGTVLDCDDGDLCTVDSCDDIGGCQNVEEPIDPGSCVVAGKFQLQVKDTGNPAKNSLKWAWKKGAAVDPLHLGTPLTSTTYALCVYDNVGGVPSLEASMVVPPSAALWTGKPGLVKYSDKPGTFGGVTGIKGKASLSPGKSGMQVKVAGSNFVLPGSFSGLDMFAQNPSVVVQLVNDAGGCWTTEFTPAQTKVNEQEMFNAKGP